RPDLACHLGGIQLQVTHRVTILAGLPRYTSSMLLAIDVGNDGIKFGVFDGDRRLHDWRIPTRLDSTSDELGLVFPQPLREADVDAAAIRGEAVYSVFLHLYARIAV